MRIWETIVGCCIVSATLLAPREAAAQEVPAIAVRDSGIGTLSNVFLGVGIASVALMPRVYYSDPETTVGWKGRWHWSALAPVMTLTALTIALEIPVKESLQSVRPGCTVDQTTLRFPGSGCETFGGPSTHAFASWGATGMGSGIFLVDTFKYSGGRFNLPAFIGNVGVPLVSSVFVSVARGIDPSSSSSGAVDPLPFEDTGQIFAGAATGFLTGLTLGAAYAILQRPSCPYGNAVVCW